MFENNSFSILAEILNLKVKYEDLLIKANLPKKYSQLNSDTANWLLNNKISNGEIYDICEYYLHLVNLLDKFKVPEYYEEEI